MGSGKSSRCEAHVDAQRGHNTRRKRRQRGTRKGKDAWPGSSRRRPMGDQDSLRPTGEDGKVKFWSGCLADIPLAGVPSREALAASDVRSILESRMVEPRR